MATTRKAPAPAPSSTPAPTKAKARQPKPKAAPPPTPKVTKSADDIKREKKAEDLRAEAAVRADIRKKRQADADARRAALEAQREADRKKRLQEREKLKQQQQQAKAYLDASNRANGSMPIDRRMNVVAPALRRLGYTPDQARTIAIDAPLNAGTYNEQAVKTALEYAESVSKPQAPGSPQTVGAAITPAAPIPMPDSAKKALYAARATDRDFAQSTAKKNVNKFFNAISSRVTPVMDKMSNVPVYGGIGGLFALNILFLLAIVPANAQGYTRLQLLWLTLMNRTALPEEYQPQPVPNSAMVSAVMSGAKALEDTAISVASLGQNAQNVINAIEAPGQAIQGISNIPVVGGLIGAGLHGAISPSAGLSYNTPPQTATGSKPPAPPPGPPRLPPPTSGAL